MPLASLVHFVTINQYTKTQLCICYNEQIIWFYKNQMIYVIKVYNSEYQGDRFMALVPFVHYKHVYYNTTAKNEQKFYLTKHLIKMSKLLKGHTS